MKCFCLEKARGPLSGNAAAVLLCFPGWFSSVRGLESPLVPSVDRLSGRGNNAQDLGTHRVSSAVT